MHLPVPDFSWISRRSNNLQRNHKDRWLVVFNQGPFKCHLRPGTNR